MVKDVKKAKDVKGQGWVEEEKTSGAESDAASLASSQPPAAEPAATPAAAAAAMQPPAGDFLTAALSALRGGGSGPLSEEEEKLRQADLVTRIQATQQALDDQQDRWLFALVVFMFALTLLCCYATWRFWDGKEMKELLGIDP